MKTAGNVILQFEPLSTYYSKLSCKMSYTPLFLHFSECAIIDYMKANSSKR